MFSSDLIFQIPALLIALTVHEYAHAQAAVHLGDPTPRYQGRLTLNPLAHLDLLGTIMLLVANFGWAKPVQINTRNFKNWRRDTTLVSLAGPFSNIFTAFITLFLIALMQKFGYTPSPASKVFISSIYKFNIMLAIFNLLPIPPLDGSKALTAWLPYKYGRYVEQLDQYGPFLLIALIYLGVISFLLRPMISLVSNIIYTIIYTIL